ncbi:PAS domain S-box protein [Hymenobacter busanensis]|uniref:histidine kinase n=1 Tax=Hymenobacter busanensis TaxID=2607656 RepID=A0A7L5A2L7_9BACT|nr:PAS domain-containing hybrid sensor histidine kinase/response regulator [Hymenobacter busanensis]KAA9333293.1 PAS domain S-box protein [Hymenobacter busanensis]QHJ08030.1 PAS domain S-box protein [Hymenobacter busanensis]
MNDIYARHTRFQSVKARRWQSQQQHQHTSLALAAAQAEAAELRLQLQQYHADAAQQMGALLHTLPTAVLAETPEGRIALVNQRFCDLLALPDPPAALLGQLTADVLHSARYTFVDYAAFAAWADATIAAGRRREDGVFYLTNGSVVQIDYLPLRRDEQVVLHLWNYENVTQQHHAQESIRRLSLLSEHSPNPIICFDSAGNALYANAAATPMLEVLTATQSEEHSLVRRMVAEALAAGSKRTAEYPIHTHFYIWTVVPLPGGQGANLYLTDISVRRRAEAELRRSQHFLARINDTLPTLVFLFDLQPQRCVYCNEQVYPLLGYSADEIQRFASDELLCLLHPDDIDMARESLLAYPNLREGDVADVDLRLRHRDGTWRWLSVKTTVFVRDDTGRVQQILGAAEDISARHAAEEALARSQRFMERVANTVPNTIYLYDLREKRNLYCNRHINAMLGYTEQELRLMGNRMTELLSLPEDQALIEAYHQKLLQADDDEVCTLEYRLRHRNGSVRWVSRIDSVFARDAQGQVVQVVGSAENVTHRKLAEAMQRDVFDQLAEQNRLFRQVIDTTPHLIYLKDLAGRYVLANQATADLYGLSVDELVDTPPARLHVGEDAAARYLAQDQHVIAHRQELTLEETFHRPDGTEVCFYSIKRPFVQADGTVLVLGVDSNITALKQAQQELRLAKDVAEENARVKQEFLTNMSHEIRTPLNGILGMAGLLYKTDLSATQNQYLGHIRQSAEHLLVVINDVLATTQLGSGKLQLECIPFSLYTLLHDSLQSLAPRATEKGLDLLLELPQTPQPPVVLGDPHRLRQIVLNLLSNAIKFTERGHVLLRLSAVEGAEPARFQVAVADTGIGIPQHQLESIFEPFTQASASTAREYGGSGLGLSISRGLAELLGGRVWAESRPGHGSTFFAELPLPLAASAAEQLAPAAPPEFQLLRGHRVLLVEDNAVNQLLVRTLLLDWGLHVDTAANGPAALVLFGQYVYDAVLMDIQMPGMDGVAATHLLRQNPDPQRAATPVVALTAHALPEEERRCRAAGMTDYLVKPFREEQLFYVLQNAFHKTSGLPQVSTSPLQRAEEPPAQPGVDMLKLRQRMASFEPDFARHLAGLFVRTTPPVLAELEQHAARHDWQALSTAAHYLKSSCEGLGLKSLRPLLQRLESSVANPPARPAETAAVARQLAQHLQSVVDMFNREYVAK